MHYIWTWALQRHLHDTHARSKAGRLRPSSACLRSWRDPLRTAVSLSLYAPPAFSMPPAATAPPAPAAGATPNTLPAPAQPHSFTRVTVPGTDKELDYVSVAKGADVVKAFPKLGWVDSSSLAVDTVAAPLLSIAGVTDISTKDGRRSSVPPTWRCVTNWLPLPNPCRSTAEALPKHDRSSSLRSSSLRSPRENIPTRNSKIGLRTPDPGQEARNQIVPDRF